MNLCCWQAEASCLPPGLALPAVRPRYDLPPKRQADSAVHRATVSNIAMSQPPIATAQATLLASAGCSHV